MSLPILPPLPHTDPTALYRYRDSLYATDLLTAAIVELDVFTHLDARPSDLEVLCRSLSIHPRPTDVMLTLLVAMVLLERHDGTYRPTDVAREHLVSSSPWFLGPYYASFRDRPVCKDFVTVLRTGRPANWASAPSRQDWVRSMEEPAFARQFTSAMDCRGLYLGRALARAVDVGGRHRLLDIAGGSGIYACCVAEANPALRATVLERPPVDTLARRAIVKRGFGEHVSVHAGDMLAEPFPTGFDVHLFSNVLHDWDVPTVSKLLAASASALPSGGLIVIHDAHLNEEKTGPLSVACYSTLLMHATEGRCYSISELRPLLHDAGFTGVSFVDTTADRSAITATRS